MITALLIVALLLTALIAISLPFGGWGSGMDAAGKGMAMFFPFLFMLARFVCLVIAAIVLAWGGNLAWSGLPALAAGSIALALLGGLGALSFAAANLLGNAPRSYGRTSFGFLSIVAAPVVVALWMFAERYGVDPVQACVVRALVPLFVAGPFVLLLRINARDTQDRAAYDAKEKIEDEAAETLAAALPADATLAQSLRFYDGIGEAMWKARGKVMDRVMARPGLKAEFQDLLTGSDWNDKVSAGVHASAIQPEASEAYYQAILPILEAIAQHLETRTGVPDALVRETQAAIRLAGPAIHSDKLPQALMQRILDGIAGQPEGSYVLNYQHDAKILAELVRG